MFTCIVLLFCGLFIGSLIVACCCMAAARPVPSDGLYTAEELTAARGAESIFNAHGVHMPIPSGETLVEFAAFAPPEGCYFDFWNDCEPVAGAQPNSDTNQCGEKVWCGTTDFECTAVKGHPGRHTAHGGLRPNGLRPIYAVERFEFEASGGDAQSGLQDATRKLPVTEPTDDANNVSPLASSLSHRDTCRDETAGAQSEQVIAASADLPAPADTFQREKEYTRTMTAAEHNKFPRGRW